MIQKKEPITSKDFNKGLVTRSDYIKGDIDASPNTMDIQWNFDASVHKRLGASSTNTLSIGSTTAVGFSVDATGTLITNLNAYWKFDEASGTRFDQIGTSNLFDVNNNVGSIVGIKNQAASMIAVDSGCFNLNSVGNTAVSPSTAPFTISSWFYLTSTGQQTIASKRIGTFDTNISLMLHFSGGAGTTTIIDDSYYHCSVAANSGARISTTNTKFNVSSCIFDTTGNFLAISNSGGFNQVGFSAGVWTIDFWVLIESFNNYTLWTQGTDTNNYTYLTLNTNGVLRFLVVQNGTSIVNIPTGNVAVNTGDWFHVSVVENGDDYYIFSSGVLRITSSNTGRAQNYSGNFEIGGAGFTGGSVFRGYMDEFHIANNRALWISDYQAPTAEYSNDYNPNGRGFYQYWFYINSDNLVTFRASSSGFTHDGTVQATSFGAITTSTWYNAVAFYQTGAAAHIGVSVNLSTTTAPYTSGIPHRAINYAMGAINDNTNTQPTLLNGRLDETGFWGKSLTAAERTALYGGGTGNTYTQGGASGFAWASFDFGASSIRWLTISAGTGIYASSNLGSTFVTIATSRTQKYQSLTRSKNVLIATADSYDVPLYWAGSAGTFANTLAPNSAPAAKFAVNYQGFLILLNFMNSNNAIRNRGFAYADENLQLTDTWQSSFDIPSSADDEITTSFILYKFLYVSTRYSIYRVAFVGGNPDWSYIKIKDWGFVSRTAKIVTIKDVGEVCCGMSWDRKLRLFDGSDDKIISDNIENDNSLCEFAMDNVSLAGSGLVVSFAEHDNNDQNFKLCVSIGANSTETTHFISFNGRTQSFFPYDNMGFNTMVMAESANQQYLMAFDRAGYCHMMDSGNLDGNRTPINDVFDSSLLFEKSPSEVSKSQKIDFYLSPTSSGTLYFRDRVDFASNFKDHDKFELNDTSNKIMIKKSINIPKTQGVYQWQLTSSANTANPWKINRTDYFLTGLGIGQSETSK